MFREVLALATRWLVMCLLATRCLVTRLLATRCLEMRWLEMRWSVRQLVPLSVLTATHAEEAPSAGCMHACMHWCACGVATLDIAGVCAGTEVGG